MTKNRRVYQNCDIYDPRGRGSCAKSWLHKCIIPFKNLLLLSIDMINLVYFNDDQLQGRDYQNGKLHDLIGTGVLVLGSGHISNTV